MAICRKIRKWIFQPLYSQDKCMGFLLIERACTPLDHEVADILFTCGHNGSYWWA